MVNKILGMPIALLVVGLLVVGGVSAALLTYYVNIDGNTEMRQSVVWWDDGVPSLDTKTYQFAGTAFAGTTYEQMFTVKNRAGVPADVELVTTCSGAVGGCGGISWSFAKPGYMYEETINIDSSYDLEVTVVEDGDWVVWTFDFPVEEWTGDGKIALGLIIATDGLGEGPVFQIHNNDGTDSTFDFGDWLYSPWGPTIDDGWNGWHSGSNNTLVTDYAWVEASGVRDASGTDGVLEVRILRSELGNSFHWAARPTVGTGWNGIPTTYMATPASFDWGTPLVDTDNYHAASLGGELVGPFTLGPEEVMSFVATFDFDVALVPDTFSIETQLQPR